MTEGRTRWASDLLQLSPEQIRFRRISRIIYKIPLMK